MSRRLIQLVLTLTVLTTASAQPFSLDAIDEDLKTVLRTVAKAKRLGIVIPSELGGRVSVSIDSDRWEPLVDALLRSRGYQYRLQSGVLIIEREELVQKAIPSNFVTGAELLEGIQGYKTDRGTLTAYADGVVVRDTAQAVDSMSKAAERVGNLQPRVFVQCRFFETTESDGQSAGVDWSSLAGVTLASSPLQWSTDGQASTGVVQLSSLAAVIRALESSGHTESLAEPSISVVSGKTGRVLLGQQYPLPQYSFSAQQAIVQVSGFSYRDIGMSLEIAPRVAGDRVLLKLSPSVSTIGGTVTFQGVGGAVVPTINTRQVTTEVSVKSGESIVIGGLTFTDEHLGEKHAPVVSRIPFIGRLFRQKERTRTKQVLTIVLTVTIEEPTG